MSSYHDPLIEALDRALNEIGPPAFLDTPLTRAEQTISKFSGYDKTVVQFFYRKRVPRLVLVRK